MADDNPERNEEETAEHTEEASQNPRPGLEAAKAHMMEHKVDTALWATRGLTLIFCLSYLVPIFGSPASSYQKVLLSNAATSALRLQQRIPSVQFSREFFGSLLMEDSAHYLMYSLIFMYTTQPMIMVLAPVFLFALLHFASHSQLLLDLMGQNNHLVCRWLISLCEFQQRNILRMAAFVEICLMPLCVVSVFAGRVGLLTPFVYYRFLSLRYASRRNPYTRTIFYELRLTTEHYANKPFVPEALRNAVFRAIMFVSNMAPPVPPQ